MITPRTWSELLCYAQSYLISFPLFDITDLTVEAMWQPKPTCAYVVLTMMGEDMGEAGTKIKKVSEQLLAPLMWQLQQKYTL